MPKKKKKLSELLQEEQDRLERIHTYLNKKNNVKKMPKTHIFLIRAINDLRTAIFCTKEYETTGKSPGCAKV